tara:strand:- start:4217 stop:6208 length:1992 start_codon:yes stop_codon:yes gene_type:complete
MFVRSVLSVSVLCLSLNCFATDPLDQLRAARSAVAIPQLPTTDTQTLNDIFARNLRKPARPESCPMISKQYSDIVAKIANLKSLFRDSCGEEDPTRLDELFSGATAIQAELENVGVEAPSSVPSTINGQQIGDVVQNINDIFLRGKCNFRDQSFLQNSADVILRFSQLGLLVPNSNGLVLSAGGLAMSSILNLIHSLFEKRFNFEQAADRQSFIKLNCAFYDIRNDIENSGFMDVVTQTHFNDATDLAPLKSQLDAIAKGIEQQQKNFREAVEKARESYLSSSLGNTPELKKSLTQAITVLKADLADEGSTPANTRKLQVMLEMVKLREALAIGLQDFINRGLSDVAFLDNMALAELNKYDSTTPEFAALYAMPVAQYRDGVRSILLFHLERLLAQVEKVRSAKLEAWLAIEIDGTKVKDYIAAVEKNLNTALVGVNENQKKGVIVADKLKRMTSTRDFTGRDDGTENIVSILSDYDKIVEQIYGKWGDEFLKFTAGGSIKSLKNFRREFGRFSDDHLVEGTIEAAENLSELERLQSCQNALPARRDWKLAQSLAQQGHDFVVTNKELFHTSTPRLFLSWTGDRAGVHGFRSRFERIREHFISSLWAQEFLAGRPVDSDAMKLLERGDRLGRAMVEVIEDRTKATKIQELLERYKCNDIVVTD